MERGRLPRSSGINSVLPIHRLEEIGEPADCLARAQKQESIRAQRIMERRQDLLLQTRLDIDEQVAATDQVHAREGRIADEILPRKDDCVAQRLDHAIAVLFLDKEASQPFGRHVLHQTFGVETGAGFIEQRIVQVSGENLEFGRVRHAIEKFCECHRNRIGFLSGGTAQHPDAHRSIASLRDKLGKRGPL